MSCSDDQAMRELTSSFVRDLLSSAASHQQLSSHKEKSTDTTEIAAETASAVGQFVHQLVAESLSAHSSCVPSPRDRASQPDPQPPGSEEDDVQVLRARALSFVRRVFSEGLAYVVEQDKKPLQQPPDSTGEEQSSHPARLHVLTAASHTLSMTLSPSPTPSPQPSLSNAEAEHNKHFERQVTILTGEVTDLSEQLACERQSHEEAQRQMDDRVQALESRCAELEAQKQEEDDQLAQCRADLQAKSEECKALFEKAKTDLDTHRKDMGQLKLRYDLNAKEICSLQDKQDHFRKKIVAAEAEAQDKANKYEKLLQQLKEEKKKHHAATHTMEESLEVLSKTLREHDVVTKKKIFDVKTYYLKREEQILQDIEDAKPKLACVGTMTDPDPEMVRNRMQLLSLEGRLKSKATQLQENTDLIRSLKSENDRLIVSNNSLTEESKRVHDAAQLVEDTHKYLTLKLQAANTEIENVTADSCQFRMIVEKSQYDLQDSEKEVQRLTKLIISNQEKLENAQEAKALARAGNKKLKVKIDAQGEELSTLQRDYQNLLRVLGAAGISADKLLEDDRLARERREGEQEHSDEQPATSSVALKTSEEIPRSSSSPGRRDAPQVSPVGVKGVRTMRQKRTSSPKRKLQQLQPDPGQYTRCSVAYRPASAPTATARRQRSRSPDKDGAMTGHGHGQRKSKRERCQECTKPIVGKGRTLPSNVIPNLRNTSAYVQTVSPDALIQNYLDSGYPTMNRSEDMLFCSWNCAKAWNHQNSHAIVKGRTEERIVLEEEKEEQQERDKRAQTSR